MMSFWAGGKDSAVKNLTTQCVETPECVIIDNWTLDTARGEGGSKSSFISILNKHRGKLIEGSKL